MNKDNIEVNGVTSLSSYPKWIHASDSKQFYETDTLRIADQKPAIEGIMEVCVNVKVCSHKIICTPVGKKLLIQGVKCIKIIYVADKPCQSVHTAHFEIPFYEFIVLGCGKYEVCDIFAAIEDIQIRPVDCKCFSVSVLIFLCAEYHERFDCHDKHDDCCIEHERNNGCCHDSAQIFYNECNKDNDNTDCRIAELGKCSHETCGFCTKKSTCPFYKKFCGF